MQDSSNENNRKAPPVPHPFDGDLGDMASGDVPPPPNYTPAPPPEKHSKHETSGGFSSQWADVDLSYAEASNTKEIRDEIIDAAKPSVGDRAKLHSKLEEMLNNSEHQDLLKDKLIVEAISNNIKTIINGRKIDDRVLGLVSEAIEGQCLRAKNPLINGIITDLKKAYGSRIGDEQCNKITVFLAPALQKCGIASPDKNSEVKAEVLTQLQSKIHGKGVFGRVGVGAITIEKRELQGIAEAIERKYKVLSASDVVRAFDAFDEAGGRINPDYKINTNSGGRFADQTRAIDTDPKYKELNQNPSFILDSMLQAYRKNPRAEEGRLAEHITRFIRNTEKVGDDKVYDPLDAGRKEALSALKSACGLNIARGCGRDY